MPAPHPPACGSLKINNSPVSGFIPETTVPRQEKASNQLIVNSFVRASAVSLAYNNAAQITYGNEREVGEVQESLEAEYQSIIANTNLSGTTLSAMQDLRNSSRELFDDIAVTVPKIFPVFVNVIPMTILAFDYYGNVDKTEELIELNETKNVSYVSREVELLTP